MRKPGGLILLVILFLGLTLGSGCELYRLDTQARPALGFSPATLASASPAPPTETLTVTPTFFQPLPTATATLIPSLTPTWTPSPSPSPTLTPSPTPVPTATLPAEFTLPNFQGHLQYLDLDCESAAAVDWAAYFGKRLNEITFQNKLPKSDNPDFGFVGNPNAPWGLLPPNSYGVYAGPVADLLNRLGVPAQAHKGYTISQLKADIARGKPVIAWVIGEVVSGIPVSYTDAEGRSTVVAVYEHVVIVMGYTENHIYYSNRGTIIATTTGLFDKSWAVLGRMVVADR